MLAFALVPTLSRAMSRTGGSPAWAEVCTPQGARVVLIGIGEGAPLQASVHQIDHCAFCSLAGEGAAPGPSLCSTPLLHSGSAALPGPSLQAAPTSFAWRSAPARAPPASR